MKKILFISCHGVELDLEQGYADRFNDAIMSRIDPLYREYIVPYAFNWNIIVKEREQKTFQIEEHLGLSKLRRISVEIACDLLWYSSTKGTAGANDIYNQIHSKLEREIDLLLDKEGRDSAIVLHGHSLGSQICLDHCFETNRRVIGLFTTGSPISKYSGKFPDWGHLPAFLDFWVNFYANRDLVCSDFKNHPSDKIRDFVEDVKVGSWNPLNWPILKQHTLYWESPTVHKKIAERLELYNLKINS